jgi:stearoyl-CoA desaturase (delta-9 desaturase)
MPVEPSLCSEPFATLNLAQSSSGLRPVGTHPARLLKGYTAVIGSIHLLTLLVFVPWFFSWTGLVLFIVGHYIFGMLGMTLCYHRLLTHRGFTCPKWFEHFLSLLGVCCLQDSPARWVSIHRKHHQHSDDDTDPHSPLVTFLWSHLGWIFIENRELDGLRFYERYARDILRDPFYLRLERNRLWLWVYAALMALYFSAGLLVGWFMTGRYMGGVQFGASVLVWGVFARTVLGWHTAWSVNSLTHLWGYRNYKTSDNSRNNWLVALWAHGEGWHNNHHADQVSSAHGHRWWEFDVTYLTICCFEFLGLATDVVRPQRNDR